MQLGGRREPHWCRGYRGVQGLQECLEAPAFVGAQVEGFGFVVADNRGGGSVVVGQDLRQRRDLPSVHEGCGVTEVAQRWGLLGADQLDPGTRKAQLRTILSRCDAADPETVDRVRAGEIHADDPALVGQQPRRR